MRVATNAARLVRTRLAAWVQPTAANRVVTPSGEAQTLPGQGGVVTGIRLGDRAGPWAGDHVEPGLSLWHKEPSANRALRLLSCAGNAVVMLNGPTAGARGVIYGKHGAVLAMFSEDDLARIAPGEKVAIEAEGLGLAVEGEPDLVCHSCGPLLFERWIHARDDGGRLIVPVAAVLPAAAAAAGIGMPAAMFNMDLHVYSTPVEGMARDLRFGDIVAVLDQDHRYGRRYAPGWVAIGIVSHGTAAGGGHGYGLMTLLTAPADRLLLSPSAEIRFDRLLPGPWSRS